MKTRKMTDRILLESLLNKYGIKKITNAINKINENYNYNSGIFIESHDHLNNDAFRILVLDNGVNVLKNDPLEIEVMGSYTGKRYIAKLEPKYNNDYIEVNFVHSYSGELCLVKVIKELHAKYSNLPIYCFTKGFYTFKGEYKNVQKLFNDIFREYLRNLSFDFINGTMQDFLNNNINESFHINENQDNIQVLFNDLPEADDDYRDAYEEDVEVGDIDPEKEDYYEYLSRMRDMEVEDLEANINIADGKYGYYYTVCKNPDDNSVSNDLWDAIYALVTGEYCKISFVNDHIEVEVAHYNSQNRSYYKIYALNQRGCDLYEEDEDVYYGHDMAKLNNPKYFRRMDPIM